MLDKISSGYFESVNAIHFAFIAAHYVAEPIFDGFARRILQK